MSVSILVATPHAAFGELLRLSLEESRQYQVRLVLTAKEARASAARSDVRLAILDADLSKDQFVALCSELITQNPQLRLIVIPPDNNPNHPSLGGIMPHGYLNRPFYLPDLLDSIRNLFNEPVEPAEQNAPQTPDWAAVPSVLQEALEQELAHTEAIAVLVGTPGSILGSAGKLNEAAALEMSSMLLRLWDPKEKTDLMRYIRLASTKGDYLVYATEMANDLVLMMVFDPGAQLSQVRPQTKQIAQNLVSLAIEKLPIAQTSLSAAVPDTNSESNHSTSESNLQPSSRAKPDSDLYEEDEGLSSANGKSKTLDTEGSLPPVDPALRLDDTAAIDLTDADEGDADTRKMDLQLLFGVIPSPDYKNENDTEKSNQANFEIFSDWNPNPDVWQTDSDADNFASEDDSASSAPEPAPAVEKPVFSEEMDTAIRPVLKKPLEIAVPAFPNRPTFLEVEPEIDPLSDTRPHVVSTISNLNQMESVSPALSLLNYTCVLLPRLPQHYLTGELADRLAQWVQHLCVAFGWRLEGISLRPEYLQWTVQVAPSVSPGNLVRIIRQRSSVHIFNTFEYIKQQNPSGDFWATGYLIVSGPQPPSAQLLREYIAQTRKRQGIQKM